MPLFMILVAATVALGYFIWWRNHRLPLQRLASLLAAGDWISLADSRPYLVANTFLYGDFRLFRSEKAAFDILFGRLTSRNSARHFLAFVFPASGSLGYASNSPFVLQRRGQAMHPGILDQFSALTWYSDEAAAERLRQHLPLPVKAIEVSFLIEQGIGMIMFTFKGCPAHLDIARLVALAHEIRRSL